MSRVLVALALGAAAYLLTDQLFVGLSVGAVGLWLLRQTAGKQPVGHKRSPAPAYRPREAEGVAVVCKRATPQRQEWVSVKTGRLYDVLSRDGPPGAQPGDYGHATVSGSGYRIKASPKPG